jgi:hypothetical protein
VGAAQLASAMRADYGLDGKRHDIPRFLMPRLDSRPKRGPSARSHSATPTRQRRHLTPRDGPSTSYSSADRDGPSSAPIDHRPGSSDRGYRPD